MKSYLFSAEKDNISFGAMTNWKEDCKNPGDYRMHLIINNQKRYLKHTYKQIYNFIEYILDNSGAFINMDVKIVCYDEYGKEIIYDIAEYIYFYYKFICAMNGIKDIYLDRIYQDVRKRCKYMLMYEIIHLNPFLSGPNDNGKYLTEWLRNPSNIYLKDIFKRSK